MTAVIPTLAATIDWTRNNGSRCRANTLPANATVSAARPSRYGTCLMIRTIPVSPTTSAERLAATDCRTDDTPYPRQATIAPNQLSTSTRITSERTYAR